VHDYYSEVDVEVLEVPRQGVQRGVVQRATRDLQVEGRGLGEAAGEEERGDAVLLPRAERPPLVAGHDLVVHVVLKVRDGRPQPE